MVKQSLQTDLLYQFEMRPFIFLYSIFIEMATRTITDRHEYILNKISKKGKLNIDELAKEMKVSGVTIRKDLKLLEEKSLLFRTKGGASINNPYAGDKPINEKEFINIDEKKKTAKCSLCPAQKSFYRIRSSRIAYL